MRARAWGVRVPLTILAGAAAAACGGTDSASGEPATTAGGPTAAGAEPARTTSGESAPDAARRCLVRLHGKGGAGGDPVVEGDVTIISPTGNADGWGAKQWLYFPDEELDEARSIVVDSVVDCDQVILDGFSNGASFVASLYCRGENLDGRLVGVVIDDPVTDHAVDGCSPDPNVAVTLYATGALEATATPGWSCADGDWTCQGGETIGIDAYSTALGTDAEASPFTDHQWYVDAPELDDWR